VKEPTVTDTAGPCHDHSQDIGFSAIHLDEALYTIGRWVLMERPSPESVAARLLNMRFELAALRVTAIADRLIEESTAHHERERERGGGFYNQEADDGVSG
jgi:hypothetical protein